MNEYSRELMHMTTSEKADYNRRYYQRNKQYWKDYYKTGHRIGRKPGALSGYYSQYYDGVDRRTIRSGWDTRRSQIKNQRREANDYYERRRQQYKEGKDRGYYEVTGKSIGISASTGKVTEQPYSYKVDFPKEAYKPAVKQLKKDLRTAAREQIKAEKDAITEQKRQVIEEITSRMENIKLSDMNEYEKKAALKEGKAMIREMKKGYLKHLFTLFVSQIRTYGFNPVV